MRPPLAPAGERVEIVAFGSGLVGLRGYNPPTTSAEKIADLDYACRFATQLPLPADGPRGATLSQ